MARKTGPLDHLILRRLTSSRKCVKNTVFKNPVNNVTQLKRRITGAIRSTTQEMINRTWKNLKKRLDSIIRENGGHIEH